MEEARLLLDARQELYGESEPTTFDAMLQLGRALRDAGELREAERVLTASLSLQNRSPEADGEPGALDRVQPGHRPRPPRRTRGGPAALGAACLASSDRDDGIDSELSRQTATNLAITLRKLRRYGDEFPLRVRVLESTTTVARPRRRRDPPGRDRPGPDAPASRQPRTGAGPVHRGPRRTGAHRRRPADDPVPEVGHRHGAGRAQALERSGRRCSIRSWPAPSSTSSPMTPSGGVRCGNGGGTGCSGILRGSVARAGRATRPAADARSWIASRRCSPSTSTACSSTRSAAGVDRGSTPSANASGSMPPPGRDPLRHGLVRGHRRAAPG